MPKMPSEAEVAELCEWNPETHKPATNSENDGCTNQSSISVGSGKRNWHLCSACAKLPEFKRFSKRAMNSQMTITLSDKQLSIIAYWYWAAAEEARTRPEGCPELDLVVLVRALGLHLHSQDGGKATGWDLPDNAYRNKESSRRG